MSVDRLLAFLKIHPDETRMVSLMAVLFLCLQAGQGLGENAAFALFLSSVDVDILPYMYMGLGGVVFLASITFSASLSRFQNSSVVVNLLAGTIILFSAEWVLIVLVGNSISYPVLWITTYGLSVVIGTLLWTVAGEVSDARQAKRLFPLFTSMGILGSVIGNSVTGIIATLFGTPSLIIMYVFLLAVGFVVARKIAGEYFKPEPEVYARFSLWNDLRAGYEFMRGSQLFRLIAISSILYSVLYFTVDFPFSERVSVQYLDNAAGLAGFKGLFTSLTTAVTFLVSLFLANRLYTKLGIVNSVLIMPITYVVTFVLFFVSFNFWGAVGARFGQLVVLGGLGGTAWNALFNVVPSDRRGQVLAFNNGVPAQIGVVLSGLLIILSNQILQTQHILLLGLLVALITLQVTRKMQPAYGEALLHALKAGRVEVFSEEEDAFAGYKDDPSALQVILRALHDQRPDTRRIATEMLGRMGSLLAIPDLVDRLYDDVASVRAAATKALADLRAKPVIGQILLGLDDEDDLVREQTLASLPKLEVDSSPELIRILERLLKDKNIKIRAQAAVVLVYLGEVKTAQAPISRLIKSKDVNNRLVGFDAMIQIIVNCNGALPLNIDLVPYASDDSPLVRRKVMRALSLLKGDENFEPFIGRLSDDDVEVRRLVSESLKQAWPRSRDAIVHILEGKQKDMLDAALDSIPPGDADILHTLRKYIQSEVTSVWYLRTLVTSLKQESGGVALLVDTLKHRTSLSEERLVKAIGLFGNTQAMSIVRKSLNAGDAGTRAAALETLETLGDPMITKEVLPILDRGGIFVVDDEQMIESSVVIGGLLESDDYWLRAIAARAVFELGMAEHVPLLKKLKTDPVLLVKQAAQNALAGMDGNGKMKTLKTLSTLDRVLLLREIPMFSGLSPEDLEQIADVAQEQLFPAKSFICHEGEPGDSLFIIVHGSVGVLKKVGDTEATLAVRKDGEFVGEMAVLESSLRSATLRAEGDVRMLVLDGSSFKAILRDRPEVAISVLQHMSRRVRELNERVGVSA
jgi:HEAT repeat protein